jgi:Zn-dependent M28 family amino/carboxypeptidase
MRLYGKPLRLAGKPTQARGRMRFAFWGAEEHGLVGSAIMSTLC